MSDLSLIFLLTSMPYECYNSQMSNINEIDPTCNNCGYESSELDVTTQFCYNCQSAYMKGKEDAKLGI